MRKPGHKPEKKKKKKRVSVQQPLPRIDVTTIYDTLTLEEWKQLRS